MQLIAYIIVYPIAWLISILPFRLLYLFSDVLYLVIYKLIGYRKSTVINNLKLVFPEKTDKEIRSICRKFYRHFCDMMVESVKSMTISAEELKRRFSIKNIELVKTLEADKKNIALMCGHYGSWEWIFALQYHIEYEGYAIYKRLRNKYFDRLVKRIRARHNSYLITTKETFDVVRKTEKEGRLAMYGFAADQSPKANKAHHWNNFMGIKVPMYTGAETLAKKFDLAVVFFRVKRLKRGFYELEFEVINENPSSVKDFDITDSYFRLLEDQILEEPQYYLWTHKRWKHKDKIPQNFL